MQRVGARVDQPAEERELRRAVRVQQAAVVAAEDVAGDLADRVALRRRDEDVRDRCAPPSSWLIVVSVCMSSTSGSASRASSTCAAPANRSGRSGPAIRSCAGAIEFRPTTITRSAPSDSAGLIGALRRMPPSKYQPAAGPSWISTAGNAAGIAEEARTCSSFEHGGDVVDAALVVADLVRRPALVEDDAAARQRAAWRSTAAAIRRPCVDVLADALERDRALERVLRAASCPAARGCRARAGR